MTVSQLICQLQQLDPNKEVYLKDGYVVNEIRELTSKTGTFAPKKWIELGYNSGS